MTMYGLVVSNPAGQLVVSSDAPGYGFISRPSPTVSGSYSSSTLYPYQYVVNIGTNSLPPMVFLRPSSDRLMMIDTVYSLGGGNWQINVFGVTFPGSDPVAAPTMAQPDIYVFGPMSAASAAPYGLQLFNKDQVKVFDTSLKPMWIRTSYVYPYVSGTYHPAVGLTDSASMVGDSITIGGASVYGILGTPRGFAQAFADTTGEPSDYWRYGFYLSGTTLGRRRFYGGTYRPAHTYDEINDEVTWVRESQRVIVTDLSIY